MLTLFHKINALIRAAMDSASIFSEWHIPCDSMGNKRSNQRITKKGEDHEHRIAQPSQDSRE